MPIETPQGTLDVENAKLRASEIIATASVGIGTTDSNQAYPLQIFKETGPDIRIQEGATSSSAARLYSNNSNLYIQTGTNFTSGSSGDIAFQTMLGQSTHMIVKSDGKVGVGTGSPGSKLHVYDGTVTRLIVEGGNNTIGTDTAQIILRNKVARRAGLEFQNDSDNSQIWHIGRRYASGGASTKLSFSNVNDDEVMTITNAGNVGIGESSPITKFHIVDANPEITLKNTGGSSNQTSGMRFYGTFANYANDTNTRRAADIQAGFRNGSSQGTWGYQYMSFHVGKGSSTANDSQSLNDERMCITGTGNVGIGTTNPDTMLHISRLSDYADMLTLEGKSTSNDGEISGGIVFKHASAHADGYRGITWYNTNSSFLMGGVTMAVGPSYNNCRIAFHAARSRADGDTVRAYIDSYGGGGDLNFTGQHRTFIKDVPFTEAGDLEGLIVSADQNKYIKMSGGIEAGSNAITTNESLPVVSISTTSNDKKCFGVISASEDPETREEQYGNFVSVSQKEEGDTRVYVNSLGEGAIWVTNTNGPLESGDYITTSNVAGYGMKQDSEFLANYTVAKITMDCDFNPPTQPKQQIVKELTNVNYYKNTSNTIINENEYSQLNDEQKEEYTLEVREELVNTLDEHGQLQWEDHPTETEKAYKIRYLTADGTETDEANAVHIAAFVGCTYHCG